MNKSDFYWFLQIHIQSLKLSFNPRLDSALCSHSTRLNLWAPTRGQHRMCQDTTIFYRNQHPLPSHSTEVLTALLVSFPWLLVIASRPFLRVLA